MLTFQSKRYRLCDGLARRDFLAIGSLGIGSLALPQLLRAEAAQGISRSHKAVINIYLTGGPPHQDMVDLKPDAPAEIRGEFSPIATNVPGIHICEHMPRLSRMMDKLINIRTLVGSDGRHSSFQCVTGRPFANQPQGGWPELGSMLSRLQGPARPGIPATLDLSMHMEHLPYNLPGPGFLGQAHAPFKPTGPSRSDMVLPDVLVKRFDDRRELLAGLDVVKRKLEKSGFPQQADAFTQQAMEVLTSSALADALDLEKEDPRIRERYGKDDPNILSYSSKGYQAINSKFLLARRLVEAGARCVSVSWADFDWHGGNFSNGKKVLPKLDEGLSALVMDLDERGLSDDVTVVVWGEFGRTPKINPRGGRDHWGAAGSLFFTGGGVKTGQVIGKTDSQAASPTTRPYTPGDVTATIYTALGIDHRGWVDDIQGRPRQILEHGRAIPDLF
ncbi:MAG: DUF1501 domain-containing protein [Pirellulaceae bacterium]|nr:DUF1501 domain-containing protein [Pirellulaceae bacterium]